MFIKFIIYFQITDLPFFASKVRIGVNGIEEYLPIGKLTEYEQESLQKLKAELTASINKGLSFSSEKWIT